MPDTIKLIDILRQWIYDKPHLSHWSISEDTTAPPPIPAFRPIGSSDAVFTINEFVMMKLTAEGEFLYGLIDCARLQFKRHVLYIYDNCLYAPFDQIGLLSSADPTFFDQLETYMKGKYAN